ncbi:hypothetical protein GCM10023085_48470 [Actinomadura viridis]|uniref:Uncharacterized protein n=1 Tax=Actinomadura viridis TaxID=58110 RepID=A0A931DJN3_9ACTN|nr:hypothetical protein [Actinomadura viridis]MBG6090652.1 hypothetical protein [Actinomadura viridis]
MEGARGEGTRWSGPGGLRVAAVRLAGAHRVWASFAGVPPGVQAAFLVTDGGAFVGRGYYTSVEELAEVVDLAALKPG